MQFYSTFKNVHFPKFSKFLKIVLIINLLEKYGNLGMVTGKVMGKRIV